MESRDRQQEVRLAQGEVAGFSRQLRAAFRKNLRLKLTVKCSSFWETMLPVIFVAATMLIWYAVGQSNFPSRQFLDPELAFFNASAGIEQFVCINRTVSHVKRLKPCPTDLPSDPKNLSSSLFCFGKHDYVLIDDICTLVHPYLIVREFLNFSNAQRIPTLDEMFIAQTIALAMNGGRQQSWWPFEGGDIDVIHMVSMRAIKNGGVLYVSPDNAATRALVDYMNTTSNLFKYMFGGFFPAEDAAMKNSTRFDRKDPYIMGVLHAESLTPSNFDVTLRLNRSAVVWTDKMRIDDIYNGGMEHDCGITYYSSGFLTLQKVISEYYVTKILNMSLPDAEPVLVPMPYPEYTSWDFLVVGSRNGYIPLFLVLSFLYTVSQITKNIVIEKETRTREAMKIMGLGNGAFYTSWFLTYSVEILIAALMCSAIGKVSYLPRISFAVLFLLYFLFGTSCIGLSILLSSFFSKARISALVAPVLFVILSIPMFLVSNMPVIGRGLLLLLCPSAMAQGASLLAKHEQGGGMPISALVSKNDDINMLLVLIMLASDTILYMVLAVYFDLVLPSEWGTRKHPLFCFMDLCSKRKNDQQTEAPAGGVLHAPRLPIAEQHLHRGPFPFEAFSNDSSDRAPMEMTQFDRSGEEPELAALRSQSSTYFERICRNDSNPVTVRTRNLVKMFDRADGQFTAVDKLNLDLRENEINVLLGHNGAGKTTTINLITGMLEIDHGDCIVYGHSASDDLSAVRHEVGLCPQHNILWPELTCDEHLRFFGAIKGVEDEQLEKSIAEVLESVDLAEKRHELAGTLSGGQKRKLSVAIAFVGGSRLVILDEPTAGMDVAARRHTWDLIKKLARGRTILLTTHFMDEADLLGHTISIMSKGKLRCQGSSSFLKTKLGVGYTLTLSVDPSCDIDPLKQFVVAQMKDAVEKQSGSEEVAFTLPTACSSLFPSFFQKLEETGPTLGMRDLGLSMTTLEEVFLKIAKEEEIHLPQFGDAIVPIDVNPVEFRQHHKIWDGNDENDENYIQVRASCASQFASLIVKRFHYAKRDNRTLCFQIFAPIVCILIAFLLSNIKFLPDAPKMYVNVEMYKESHIDKMRLDMSNCDSIFEPSLLNPMYVYRSVDSAQNSSAFNQYLLETYKTQDPDRYVSVFCDDPSSSVNPPFTALFHNGSALHSRAEVVGLFYSLYTQTQAYRSNSSAPQYKMAQHPMDWTDREKANLEAASTFMIIFFVIIPFTFIPSTYVSYVVKEKETKAKHLQLVSGMRYYVYWVSNYAFDSASFLVTESLCMIVFAIFGREEYIGSAEVFFAAFVLFLLYGLSSVPASYVTSFWFEEHSGAQNFVMMANFLCGFFLVLVIFILKGFSSTESVADILQFIFRLIPSYSFSEGLISLGVIDLKKSYGLTPDVFSSNDGIGWPIVYMSIGAPLFFIVMLLLDHPQRLANQRRLFHDPTVVPPPIENEDQDVIDERTRIENWNCSPRVSPSSSRPGSSPTCAEPKHCPALDAVVVQHLCKRYASNNKLAIKNMSFGVHQREVFGFLGTNGAGKTTAISILCGEQLPTHGRAFVNSIDVVENTRAAQSQIGYCPQFDAILDLLTPEEHLNLFAGLRGYTGEKKAKVVKNLLDVSGLAEHAGTVAAQLSGGNKRKLSVALALTGRPLVVFLDEPSAGMDPVARHRLWEVIQDITAQCAVVLTTHHLEEVEALAHRVAIMADGQLMCIGDKTHLKTKYGSGYEMTIRCKDEMHVQPAQHWLVTEIRDARLIEYRNLRSTFSLPPTIRLSRMFSMLEASKEQHGIKDFTLSQSSIEQVFLRFAASAEENAEV